MSNKNYSKLYSLELLRFLAANLVVSYHYLGFQKNIIGVDIFFVISGFVMMYATENNTRIFFLRRLIRIIPLYWLMTVLFVTILFFFPNLFLQSYFDLIFLFKSLMFIPFENNGVGPGFGHSPYLFIGWTLNYEIFFYLLFQISILISKNSRGSVCILIILLNYYIVNYLNLDNFILLTYTHPIVFEFCFGIFIYFIWKLFNDTSNSNRNNLIFSSILILMILFVNLSYNIKNLLPVIIVACFLMLKNRFLKYNFILILGNISYAIYLTHPYIKRVLDKTTHFGEINNMAISYISCIIVSYILYVYYEKKIIFFLNKKSKEFFIQK